MDEYLIVCLSIVLSAQFSCYLCASCEFQEIYFHPVHSLNVLNEAIRDDVNAAPFSLILFNADVSID